MSFASAEFIVFFLIVLGVTAILQRCKNTMYKEVCLLLASYFFYGYWDWRFCFLLLAVTACSYFTALWVNKKPLFVLGVAAPLVVLAFFKYFNFFLSSFSALTGSGLDPLAIILPVGISFYTFQALSYVIDVKRQKYAPERNFIKLALYISFFPQLVAGPIVKASEFLPQLKEDRRITRKRLEQGVQLMLFGLMKKIVIADHLSVFVDDVFHAPEAFSWISILLAIVSYSIQIYFDFSGYSDIAIGCAKCFGYDFYPNFNLPYISENVTVFWRRWHISLSTWLKEYLYIALGGNRKGKPRQYLNLLLTMLLGGLWHGANWTFVFWGALHGVALCIHKLFSRKKAHNVLVRAGNILLTFFFVSLTWVFFRADNFATAWSVLEGLFTLRDGIVQPFFWTFVAIAALLISTIAAILKAKKSGKAEVEGYYPTVKLTTIPGLTIFFVVCGLLVALAFTGEHPFVYFQF